MPLSKAPTITLKNSSGAAQWHSRAAHVCMEDLLHRLCLIFFHQTVREEQLWTEIKAFGFSTFSQLRYLGYSSKIIGKHWTAERKLFKNIPKSLPGFLTVSIRKCQLIDASGVLSTPLASSHTSFSLLFGCKREVKHTNSVPLVIFYRCSLLDTSGNCQKRDRSGCLMDYFPVELIVLGVRLSHTPLWQLKWTIFFFFCVPCTRICSTGPETKRHYGNFQQKAHGSHSMGKEGRVLNMSQLSFKGAFFKGSRCCLSAKLLPGVFKVLLCPQSSYTELMTVERN